MSALMNTVDGRTRLAGTNRLEVLLFSLGTDADSGREEVFGINVFKVREVMHVPEITRAPDMPDAIEGMTSLRGETVPVINLRKFCGVPVENKPGILIVTEYNKHVQGFLVHSVDSIHRLAWEDINVPPSMLANQHAGLITAVTKLPDHRLVMIMDVEKVLAETAGFYDDESVFDGIGSSNKSDANILFVDDSSVARGQIRRTLEHMGLDFIATANGQEAWEMLEQLAEQAEDSGSKVADRIDLVLTDIEMPEMDGYVLTRKIKGDTRFKGIPVVMHSSLSAEANQALGKDVGADAYIAKFEPRELAKTLEVLLNQGE